MNIYFSGIGGVGIGPLAEIAYDAGYSVIGSDPVESLTTNELHKKGIEISKNQDGSFLQSCYKNQKIDWFIYTSALPKDHPELILAKKLGIHTAKRDELLAYIIRDKKLKLIAIAGTHGKTTTTSMMVWTLQKLGIPVSYSIGTTLSFGPSGKYDPKSEYFVYECDEFDRNFLQFKPYLAIITTIDYDHSDTYKTPDDYLMAFRQFARQSEHVISWSDQNSKILSDLTNTQIIDLNVLNREIRLPGAHNRRNATIVQLALKKLGINQDTNDILNNYPGVDRRFEKLADNLYSDYGHHPVEIAAAMQMARELADHVILVYQPHQNIRQYELKNQYTNQFELADVIYWLPTYLSRENPDLPILKPEELIKNITNKSKIHIADFDDKLWAIIQAARKQNKLVLCMGAGTIDGWIRDRLNKS